MQLDDTILASVDEPICEPAGHGGSGNVKRLVAPAVSTAFAG